jgi:hypothetical protein
MEIRARGILDHSAGPIMFNVIVYGARDLLSTAGALQQFLDVRSQDPSSLSHSRAFLHFLEALTHARLSLHQGPSPDIPARLTDREELASRLNIKADSLCIDTAPITWNQG